MITHTKLQNFTAFEEANLNFGPGLNIFIGENGTGKSHILKIVYAILAVSFEEGKKPNAGAPTKSLLQPRLAEKMINVFRPETLGRIVRRGQKQKSKPCGVMQTMENENLNIAFAFKSNSKNEVTLAHTPEDWIKQNPIFFPTRELLTIYPGFFPVYEGHYLEFEETWRDTCLALGAPALRGKEKEMKKLLVPLEDVMGGTVVLDNNGRFYLKIQGQKPLEAPMLAEGYRKIAMLAQLITNGTLFGHGYLFWDEPEANLNPKLIRLVAEAIFHICKSGIQVFVATHSLFFIRELSILSHEIQFRKIPQRYFAFERTREGVSVSQGDSVEHVDPLVMLDENLNQSDRFLAVEDE